MIPGPNASAPTKTLRVGSTATPESAMCNRRFSSGRGREPHHSFGRLESRTQREGGVISLAGESNGATRLTPNSTARGTCVLRTCRPDCAHAAVRSRCTVPARADTANRGYGLPEGTPESRRAQCDLSSGCPSAWRVPDVQEASRFGFNPCAGWNPTLKGDLRSTAGRRALLTRPSGS